MRFIGLDLHKRTLEVCILSERGSVLARHSVVCERSALNRFAEESSKRRTRFFAGSL